MRHCAAYWVADGGQRTESHLSSLEAQVQALQKSSQTSLLLQHHPA